MSRSNGRRQGRLAGDCGPASSPIAGWACAWACVSLVACGGLQRTEPSDASTDGTEVVVGPDGAIVPSEGGGGQSVPLAVGPGEPDPCGAAQRYEYRSFANFDGLPQLAGRFAPYVSYDGTGVLYEAVCDSNSPTRCSIGDAGVQLAPPKDETNRGGDYISGTLCANCTTALDGGGCSACSCTSGFQPSNSQIPPLARCGADVSAMHLHTSTLDGAGLSNWGMNFSVDLRQNCPSGPAVPNDPAFPSCSFDATQWTGISFWALLGPGSSSSVALATVGDPNTAGVLGGPSYPFNTLVCGNPGCMAGVGANITNACTAATMPLCLCDPFGQGVGLLNQWTFYAIPFDVMRQKGYGKPVASIDLAHILSFTFGLGKANWDVWLDDIAFYRPKTN